MSTPPPTPSRRRAAREPARARWIAALALIAVLAAACQDSPGDQAKAAVIQYLHRLIQARRSGEVAAAAPLLGEKMRRALGLRLSGPARQVVLPDAKLEELQFAAIRLEDGRVEVDTMERWRWFPPAPEGDSHSGVTRAATYRVRYLFRRAGRSLVLDAVEPLGATTASELAAGPHVVAPP